MTASQALRRERRRQRAEMEARARRTYREIIVLLAFCILVMCIAAIVDGGVSEADLEMREIAFWASRGVTIARW